LEAARRIDQAYQQWGRGFHPAALNFGDCFAYKMAKEHAFRLLYVGNDLATPISRARCERRVATRSISEVCGISRAV
jgi:uncharacterized protein with PIN domain